jgi:uncharacterized cupin superfamily protein
VADWFVVNVADAQARKRERRGILVEFDAPGDRFPDIGVNIRVLEPGQPAGLYHRENVQEDFLVLSGECLAIVEGEERRLRAWDFFHCPAGTTHVFVGAGEGPCAVLMVGARGPGKELHYPADEAAARHGASVGEATSSPREAYASWDSESTPVRLDWPPPG